jgi:hypothetical protein
MGRHKESVEKHRSTSSWASSRLRSYDANSKLMVINQAVAISNSTAGKKFGATECNVCRWRLMKDKLRNVNSSGGSKKGHFHELEQHTSEDVCKSH